MSEKRGVIGDRERRRQILDMSGLRWGKITPTDIDGLIEYRGKCFVYFEIKYNGAEMQDGQRIALERVCDTADRPAIIIVARHDIYDWEVDVTAHECEVIKYYFEGEWREPKEPICLRAAIDRFLEWKGE